MKQIPFTLLVAVFKRALADGVPYDEAPDYLELHADEFAEPSDIQAAIDKVYGENGGEF